MFVSSAISTATFGIQQNLQQFSAAADRIASPPMDADTIQDVADLMTARYGISANGKVLRIANDVLGSVINILA